MDQINELARDYLLGPSATPGYQPVKTDGVVLFEEVARRVGALERDYSNAYGTRAELAAAAVPAVVTVVGVAGCLSVSDLGDGRWQRVATEPSHLGKVRTADRYLPDGSVSSGSGGWWELVVTEVRLQHFAHLVTDFGLSTEDWLPAMNAARDYAVAKKVRMRSTGRSFALYGQFTTKTGLHMVWDNLCWWIPKAWSSTGSIITNVSTVSADRAQTDITLENPHLDGSSLPYDLASNDNAIGFAWGAGRVRIIGGYIKNFAFSWSGGGSGGKAVNFEAGVYDATCIATHAEGCGVGFFAQGYDGTHTTGASKGTTRVRFISTISTNCQCAVALFGINTSADPDGDVTDSFIEAIGPTAYDCGHAPDRPMSTDFQKSGIFVLGEAQNARLVGARAYNDNTYPSSWPAGGSNVAGAGLSGPVGAVLWGWGRNIDAEIEYHGSCDALVRVNRARAIGDDASSTGIPQNVYRFDVRVTHFGTAGVVLDTHATLKPDDAEFTGRIEAVVDTLSTGIVGANASGYDNVEMRVTQRGADKDVTGAASQIYARGNTLASLPTGRTDLRRLSRSSANVATYTIGDDGLQTVTLPAAACHIRLYSATSTGANGFATVYGGVLMLSAQAGSSIERSDAVLTAGAGGGTDGKLTLSEDSGTLYISNRLGASLTVRVEIDPIV